ncbi:MAG: DUF456 domain-containing protein [Anaerolineae bacterium]|jgi:uncharacterized protein|nr:DUF456 domain-containing protein [Anaerolineae bacterium]MBT7074536.1 DUF456 domain-containing protein [Anaerolineae bacterium]MBT7781689.1 DUF456 domain-containing protein [Anaerolineae bacterium]
MPAWLETSITIITLIIMLFGLFGLIMPVFPGLVIIWLAALGFGIISGFGTAGWGIFIAITILMLIGNISDGLLMAKKALEHGAAKISLVLAGLVSIVVSLFFSPLAGLIAAPTTLYLSEKNQGHTPEEAKKITKGLMVGWGWAFVLRFIIGIMMIILWVIWA